MSTRCLRCQVLPQPDDQVAFHIDGMERLRWHFGPSYPRPFFYPLIGPSGSSLTRMGHPGAPDHDHHRSVWFAHEKVLGIDFWTDRTTARIMQKSWLAYQDGDDQATVAVLLGWYDGHNPQELLEQELVASVRPGAENEIFLEIQAAFRPVAESLEFGQTNFGFLGVRVAKNLSAHFGGGAITNSEGKRGEAAVFGQPAAWVDYSGHVPLGLTEGITYFDHPSNPGHPTRWHVREDGWMAASVCMRGPITTTRTRPLELRYLLHAHRGDVDRGRAAELAQEFATAGPYATLRSQAKHQKYEVRRQGDND